MDGVAAWVWWVVAAVVLGIVEVTTLDLIFLMLAAGALAGAATALATDNVALQAIAALVVAVAMLGLVRPIALRHLRTPIETRTGVAALVGAKALVVERVDGHGGRVKLAGEVWSARSYDGETVLEPGASVDVVEIDGATALVL